MKRILLIVAFGIAQVASIAQQSKIIELDYASKKAAGLINQPNQVEWRGEYPDVSQSRGGGNCWIPFDGTYTTILSSSDDGTSGVINLPFTFCFYGTNYNAMYINTNGNISFGASYTGYTSTGFPTTVAAMIAGFWADVDTRGIGDVRYKVFPTYAVITWNNVGYYNSQTNLTNTFQIVITDGNDPILAPGNNVRLAYQDMQWTTGSASSGTGGFGGTAATVGMNSGDGTTFLQIGRFDQNNSNYDGPGGNNDGVSYLDNQCFEFAVCSNQNIAPNLNDFAPTLYNLCVGQTATISGTGIGPEVGQNVTFTVDNGGLSNVVVNNNTPGTLAALGLTVTATAADIGTSTLVITATDNGTPVATSTVSITINVTAGPTPTITGGTSACPGQTVALSAPAGFASYAWSPSGGSGQTANVGPGGYTVTVTDGSGCSGTSAQYIVNQDAAPTPFVTGPTNVCPGSSATLTADAGYATYSWSPSGGSAQTAFVPAGTYTVSVTTAAGCQGISAPFTITPDPNIVPVIVGNNSLCPGQTTTLDAGAGYDSYTWSPGGETTQSINVGTGTYSVSVVQGPCSGSSVQFTVADAPDLTPVITGNSTVCIGVQTTLDAGAGYATYTWSGGNGTSQTITTGAGTYSVSVTDGNGCSGTSPLFTVTLSPDLSPVISGDLNFCTGAGAVLDAGSGYATYTWNPGGITGQTATLPVGTYTVSVTDSQGCSGTSQAVSVTNNLPQAPVITGPTGVCGSSTVTLDAGTGFSTYSWTPGGQSTQTINVGQGTYTVTGTSGPGCSATSQPFTVGAGVAPSPVITGPAYYCVNDQNGVTLSVDPNYVSYSWSPGGFSTADVFVPGGNYTVAVTDSDGCVGTASFTVTQVDNPAIPLITANGPTDFCQGGSVMLSGPEGLSQYIWSTGSFTPNITAFEAGTYILYVIDDLGCQSATNSITITTTQLPTAAFSAGINQFEGNFVNLSQNSTTYEWNYGDGATSASFNGSNTYSAPGVYDVMLIASNACGADTVVQTISIMSIGVDDQDVQNVLIWPNPAHDEVFVELSSIASASIYLFDARGRVVLSQPYEHDRPAHISVFELAQGMYTLRVVTAVNVLNYRVIVQH